MIQSKFRNPNFLESIGIKFETNQCSSNDDMESTNDEVADEKVQTKLPAVIDSEFITDDEESSALPSKGSGIFIVQYY